MLSVTVLAVLALNQFDSPAQGGRILTKPTGAAKAAQATAMKAPPRPPAAATVDAVDEGFVDWSYLRLNSPALVEARIARVRNGEADLATLGGLARMDKLKEYASGGSRSKPPSSPTSGGPSSKNGVVGALNRGSVLARPGTSNSPLVKASSAATVAKLMIPLDVSPSRIDFGSVVDGQAVRKTVYIRNVPAGVAKATLSAKSPFHILKVRVLDGRYAMLRAGAWRDSLVASFGAEASGIPADLGGPGAFSAARPRLDPNVVGRLNSGPKSSAAARLSTSAATVAALAKRTEATQAPFEVDAPEGAAIRVELEFRPKFNLFNGDPVGAHKANLELTCGEQSATVALQAQFEGVNLGVITIPQDRERTLFLSPKQEKHPSGGNMVTAQQKVSFGYDLTFLNPKGEVPISITPIDLPPGVTMRSLQPKSVKNGRTEGYLELELSFWGDDRGAQYGMGQELVFSVYSPSGNRTLSLTLNLLPAIRKYSTRGSLDNVYYQIDLTCFQDGSIDCEYDFHTSNAWPTDAEFKFSIDGVQMIHYTTIYMTDNNRMKTKGAPKFQIQALADGWERFVQKGGTFWIRVEEKFRL